MQSSTGPLTLKLAQTPKLLGVARTVWCPNAFFVSFKLETDQSILIDKARSSIEKYGMGAVIANQLHMRYKEVRHLKTILVHISSHFRYSGVLRRSTAIANFSLSLVKHRTVQLKSSEFRHFQNSKKMN